MDTVLDGVNAKPDLFPENSKDVPDINFFYRCNKKDRGRECVCVFLLCSSPNCVLIFFQVNAGNGLM